MANHLLTYPVFFFKDLTSFEMSYYEGEQELRMSQNGTAEGCEGGGQG